MKNLLIGLLVLVPCTSFAQEIQAPKKPILIVFTNERSAVGAVCQPCVQFASDYRENVGGLRDFLTQNFSKYIPTGNHYGAVEWSGVTLGPLGGFDQPGLYRRFKSYCPEYGLDRVQPIRTPTFWVLDARGQWKEGYQGTDSLITFLRQYVAKPPTIVIPPNPDLPQESSTTEVPTPTSPQVNTEPVNTSPLLTEIKELKDSILKLKDENSSILDKVSAVKDSVQNAKEAKEAFDVIKEQSEDEEYPWWWGLALALYPPLKKFKDIVSLVKG